MTANCCDHNCAGGATGGRYRKVLWAGLAINLTLFGIEIIASIVAQSMSLRADALDFLGDAANYMLALAVVGLALRWRARAALVKGAVMGIFGLWVASSTLRNALTATVPSADIMGATAVLALAANLAVYMLLYRHRRGDSQTLSVWLCTRNDCLANISVMMAGVGVWVSGTHWSDVIAAAIIASLGLSSAWRVINQAHGELRTAVPSGVPAE
jgi:Co/Zn/Cd efflux system component